MKFANKRDNFSLTKLNYMMYIYVVLIDVTKIMNFISKKGNIN